MPDMTKIERVSAVLSGRQPDRTPVSFWYHFGPDAEAGQGAVDVHLRHLARFDLDFLKVMNDNPYPSTLDVQRASDLLNLPVLTGHEEPYARQLDLIGKLAAELSGKVLLTTTVFSAWTVLRRIVVPRTTKLHMPPVLGGAPTPPDDRITELLVEDRSAVATALEAISTSQANFARRCIEAGADGIFMSVRDDWVDTDANGLKTYDEMVRTADSRILAAASAGLLNVLHVCGVARDFDAFAAYPVHVINWADRAAGPQISEVVGRVRPVVCGGVDNLSTLPRGTAGEVATEVHDALDQAGDRPMMISAGCTYDPAVVPDANLFAMVQAVQAGDASI